MNKLTVIVAAYNVEKYIEKCIESIVKQTYKNIEILIVNDGSLDKTLNIALEYSKKYKNIKVLNKENGGLSSARNYGIKHATGEYITFVDGDDYLDEITYDSIMSKVLFDESEIGIFSYKKIYKNKIKKIKLNKNLYSGNFLKKIFSKSDEASIIVCNKIFRRDIIIQNKIFFENKAYFEDTGFIFRYLYFVKKFSILNNPFYNYVQREGSITKKVNNIIFSSKQNTLDIIKKFYIDKNEYQNYEKEIRDLQIRMELYVLNKLLDSNEKGSYLNLNLNLKDLFTINIPLKHKIAIFLIKIKCYEKIYKFLKKMNKNKIL